ncbi:MAG TPA: hypothetical protein VFK41_12475 [Nocardioidaceae bacterium]|nr:hypothetical protein [Nocardioidaceae bacterium]
MDGTPAGGTARVEPRQFQVHVDLSCSDDAAFGDAVDWWLTKSLDIVSTAWGRPVVDAREAWFSFAFLLDRGTEHEARGHAEVLSALKASLNQSLGDLSFSLEMEASSEAPVVVTLTAGGYEGEPELTDLDITFHPTRYCTPTIADELEDQLEQLLLQLPANQDITFVNVTDDNQRPGSTALDLAMKRGQYPARQSSRTVLRSYSWMLYLHQDMLARLGGVKELRQTNAFWRVTPTSQGAVLRATAHLADYQGARVRAVRDALQPVLPIGPARNPTLRTRHLRIAWDEGHDGPFDHPPTRDEIERRRDSGTAWVPPSDER